MKHIFFSIIIIFSLNSCLLLKSKTQIKETNSLNKKNPENISKAEETKNDYFSTQINIPEESTFESSDIEKEKELTPADADKTNENDYYANSIEQALDFCNASRKFREKNEHENALKALDQAYRIIVDIPETENTINQQLDDVRITIAKRILEIYSIRTNGTKGMANEIPLTLNKHIKKEIKILTGKEKRFFIYSYKRSGKYMPMILKKLKEAGLPQELAWLPLIESGFKEKALSSARALGLWQFIPSTGYKFGLKRNLYIDERLDPEASTDAAISYLKELHSIFGDWATVLAAYNCGEGRVLRTIKRQNLRYLDNFWDLYLQLPYETARYVPKFIATLHIVKNLKKYGFDEIIPYKSYKYNKIFINKPVGLEDIAKAAKVSLKELKELNPALRYNIVPPEGYEVKFPEGKGESIISMLASLPSKKMQKSYGIHKVRKGETLSQIAKRNKTSVKSIMVTNRLSKKNYIIPGQLLKIPNKIYMSAKSVKAYVPNPKTSTIFYNVRKGDSLWSVAKRFKTSPSRLKKINNLNSNILSIGQKLKIRLPKGKLIPYQVKPGDSPYKIASKHNMSLSRFLNINDMSKSAKIFPGQEVYVE